MQQFRLPVALQRFVSVFSAVRNLFVLTPLNKTAIVVHLHRLGRSHIGEAWQG